MNRPSYKQLEVRTNQTNTNNVNKTWTHLQTTGGKDEPNTNNVNKTWPSFLQTTGGKDEPKNIFYAEIVADITTWKSERKDIW